MEFKDENEITVRVQCFEDELKKILNKDKFILSNEYYAKDIFMIPKNIDIFKCTTRESLSKAILLMEFKGISSDKHKMKITFKHKKINEKGEILQQDAVNCEVLNVQDAKNIIDCIGYKEINKELSELFSSLDKMTKRFRKKFRRYAKLKLNNHMLVCSYMYQYLNDKINKY